MMHTDVDLKATACLAEPMLLMSVLDNLYSNAVHYGAESGNICLRSSLHGARVYIDVINTGTPIPQEERAMIFEPFFQGSHQRKGAVKGSGLGLSIAIRLFYLSVRLRAVLEILTYDMYAPVSPRCPCPNCLQQLRPLG